MFNDFSLHSLLEHTLLLVLFNWFVLERSLQVRLGPAQSTLDIADARFFHRPEALPKHYRTHNFVQMLAIVFQNSLLHVPINGFINNSI